MKDGFEAYLRTLGMVDVLIERVDKLARLIQEFVPEELDHIFVSETVTPEGQRQYLSLFLLSKHFVAEAQQFPSTDDFQVDALARDPVHNLAVSLKDYDFVNVGDSSRANITYVTNAGLSGTFRATGTNCVQLRDVLRSCILPNLRE